MVAARFLGGICSSSAEDSAEYSSSELSLWLLSVPEAEFSSLCSLTSMISGGSGGGCVVSFCAAGVVSSGGAFSGSFSGVGAWGTSSVTAVSAGAGGAVIVTACGIGGWGFGVARGVRAMLVCRFFV